MEKGKSWVLLGSDLVLENPDLCSPDSLDEMSDLLNFFRNVILNWADWEQ